MWLTWYFPQWRAKAKPLSLFLNAHVIWSRRAAAVWGNRCCLLPGVLQLCQCQTRSGACVFVGTCLYDHRVASVGPLTSVLVMPRRWNLLAVEKQHEIRGSRRYTAALDVRWRVISFFWSFRECMVGIFVSRELVNILWLCNVSSDTGICCELNMTDCIIKSF